MEKGQEALARVEVERSIRESARLGEERSAVLLEERGANPLESGHVNGRCHGGGGGMVRQGDDALCGGRGLGGSRQSLLQQPSVSGSQEGAGFAGAKEVAAKTGSEVCKVSAEVCEVSVVMAAEERHKSPSKLGRAGEERQKVPLGVALGVCSIGSESLTLPVTLVKVPWKGAFSLAEAERAELELLGLHSWSLNAFRVFRQITPQSPTQHIMYLGGVAAHLDDIC